VVVLAAYSALAWPWKPAPMVMPSDLALAEG